MWVNFWLHAAFFVQNKISCPGKQLDWSLLDRALSRKALWFQASDFCSPFFVENPRPLHVLWTPKQSPLVRFDDEIAGGRALVSHRGETKTRTDRAQQHSNILCLQALPSSNKHGNKKKIAIGPFMQHCATPLHAKLKRNTMLNFARNTEWNIAMKCHMQCCKKHCVQHCVQHCSATWQQTLHATLRATLECNIGVQRCVRKLHSMLHGTLRRTLRRTSDTMFQESLDTTLQKTLQTTLQETLCWMLHGALHTTLQKALQATLQETLCAAFHKTLDTALHTTLFTTLHEKQCAKLWETSHATLCATLQHDTACNVARSAVQNIAMKRRTQRWKKHWGQHCKKHCTQCCKATLDATLQQNVAHNVARNIACNVAENTSCMASGYGLLLYRHVGVSLDREESTQSRLQSSFLIISNLIAVSFVDNKNMTKCFNRFMVSLATMIHIHAPSVTTIITTEERETTDTTISTS